MILQHHDMMKLYDTQNLLPFVFYLHALDLFLYLLSNIYQEHNFDYNMLFDIFHCKYFQPFVLGKYHSHHHQYISFCHQILYICNIILRRDAQSEKYLFLEDKIYNSSESIPNRAFI